MPTKLRYCVTIAAIFISISFAAAQDYTVDLSSKGYMVDEAGMTLYYTLKDAPGNSISRCTGDCSSSWPPFYTDYIKVPSKLSTSDFNTIWRSDGHLQTTYKGWPLYYYTRDSKPGDTKGDREKGLWSTIDPTKFPPAFFNPDSKSDKTLFFYIKSLLDRFDYV